MKNFQVEFPDYPAHQMPDLGPEWQDISWRDDACPSFMNASLGVVVLVDFPDPDDRERPDTGRFYAFMCDGDGAPIDDSLSAASDSLYEIMAAISKFPAPLARRTS